MNRTRADPLDVLQKRTTNHALKAHTVEYLRSHTKSFDYTRTVMKEIYGQTEAEVQRLGGNKMLEAILHKLGVPGPEGEVDVKGK
jgi:geranylgeranyl diphosphate synthase type 3